MRPCIRSVRPTALAGFLFAGWLVPLACTTQAASPNSDSSATTVATHGLLQAKGNRIVGSHGKPVSLAGPSLFWSQWMPQYYNRDVVAWVRQDWNATIIRAAIAVEHGGYLENPQEQLDRACAVVDAAIDQGMYVIVDWHDHHAERHQAQAIKFFTEIAKRYGDKPNLIYEIYNEPLQVSWSRVIKPYAEAVIAAIRAIDPDNLIVVGTPSWSQDVDVAAQDPIQDVNVAYALHFYAAGHKQSLRDKAEKALAAGIPLFVTEWGTVNYDGDGPFDRESTEEWLAFMRRHQLSHCNWSIADKAEGSAPQRPNLPDRGVKGGWKVSDLTDSGRYVRDIVRNWSAP